MSHNSVEGGLWPSHQKRPSRTGSPDIVPTANRIPSRLSQTSLVDRPTETGSDITRNTSRSGTQTPTILGHGDNTLQSTSHLNDGIKEGLGSLNRWSQSTTSSKNSSDDTQQRFSAEAIGDGRGSPTSRSSPVLSPISKIANHTAPITQRNEPSNGPERGDLPKLQLPDIGTLPPLSSGIIDATTWQSDTTSSATIPLSSTLFQDPWSGTDPQTRTSENAMGTSIDGQPEISGRGLHQSGDSIDLASQFLSAGKKGHDKRKRGHSQKAMLSKALQKANTAVLLDNAANFEGAMEAYNDACQLLQLVMLRSNGGEDEKLKLQEIRDTYMIRVTELERMDLSFREADSKALPERPLSQESYPDMFQPIEETPDNIYADEDIDPLRDMAAHHLSLAGDTKSLSSEQIPVRRQSLLPSAQEGDLRFTNPSPMPTIHDSPLPDTTWKDPIAGKFRAPSGPGHVSELLHAEDDQKSHTQYSELSLLGTQTREIYESTSWLDTIDESGASSPASLRSKASSVYLRQRRSHRLSHGTEAEFDAALDAAVEAAYDEGLEPAMDQDTIHNDDVMANARRNVELAKQKVREAEREAEFAISRGRELRRLQEEASIDHSNGIDSDYLDEEAEEEERLLEEMTRGYIMDDFEFDLQSKSALPRQSDSSSFSGRTWESSAASNTTTAAATAAALSPLAEDSVLPIEDIRPEQGRASLSKHLPSIPVPPKTPPEITAGPGPGVRARRLSGQTSVDLTIDTHTTKLKSNISDQSQSADPFPPPPLPKDDTQTGHSQANADSDSVPAPPLKSHNSERKESVASFVDEIQGNENFAKLTIKDNEENNKGSKYPSPIRPIGKVPSAPDNLGKINPSLNPFKARIVSVPADPSVNSPDTPSSNAFPPLDLQKTAAATTVPILPTPTGTNFAPNGLPSGGLYLFDSHIHSPTSLGSPNLMAANAPLPLEPCPESFLLRPFWLMRCIYQTVAHPRGGYLTTKLFIPRDIWRVKNVKIKSVEEKVSNCDLLTAALLKLAKVDTYDADAVLEEMQSLEAVLDQVQASLAKKIGGEVGVQGAMPLFRSTQHSEDPTTIETPPAKTSSGQSKSYLSSWRKLRSKNSGVGGAMSLSCSREASKDHLTIASLPMTPIPNPQTKRNSAQLQFNGPNANYMGALARLCDAAQVLEQIAQQVEDPGLRHSSPTLVGLELSTRHAAEFFGFYVCRFVLNDIGMMLDKFIKRGSEWVLI